MNPLFLNKLYHGLSPLVSLLPNKLQVKMASRGRSYFMQQFSREIPSIAPYLNPNLSITMWGIQFRTSLCNSAGMFKNGEGYDVVARLGAGAYIGGTSTVNPRAGNYKEGISLPFITLPKSKLAINWLGLPNYGDSQLSKAEITQNKIDGCPIGWSLMRSPDFTEAEGLDKLINSLWLYQDNLQIDFIEINESCPNIKAGGGSIIPRLELIAERFLKNRQRHLPVVVKLSNDINPESLRDILNSLVQDGYDGINLGNTSTSYLETRNAVAPDEIELFNYFTSTFGGGVSGAALKEKSLELCRVAKEIIDDIKPQQEFHIIRSGGIDSLSDIKDSERCGVSFNQWYTGFFNQYSLLGKDVYQHFWAD